MKTDIDEMLCRGKVPPQEELVSPEFRDRFGFGNVHQLGLAVPDVCEAASRLEARGVGPFFIAEDDLDFWVERGESRFFHGKMGLAYLGGYELELLEAGKGSTLYSDHFREDGLIALHHVGFLDHDIEGTTKKLNDAGIKTAVRGRIKFGPLRIDFAYYDTVETAGLILESIDFRLFGFPITPTPAVMTMGAKALKTMGKKQLRMGSRC